MSSPNKPKKSNPNISEQPSKRASQKVLEEPSKRKSTIPKGARSQIKSPNAGAKRKSRSISSKGRSSVGNSSRGKAASVSERSSKSKSTYDNRQSIQAGKAKEISNKKSQQAKQSSNKSKSQKSSLNSDELAKSKVPVKKKKKRKKRKVKPNNEDDDDDEEEEFEEAVVQEECYDCPTGMEKIVGCEYFFIKQNLKGVHEESTASLNFSHNYIILNDDGKRLFTAGEYSSCCSEFFLGGARTFEILLHNQEGTLCMKIKRSRSYCLCFWSGRCNGNVAKIYVYNHQFLGKIVGKCNFCTPKYNILDANKDVAFRIIGNICKNCCPSCDCVCKPQFKIFDHNNMDIGNFNKNFPGVFHFHGVKSNKEIFGFRFSRSLSNAHKALLLGSSFMIKLQYFEHSIQEKGQKRSHGCSGAFVLCCVVALVAVICVIFLIIMP